MSISSVACVAQHQAVNSSSRVGRKREVRYQTREPRIASENHLNFNVTCCHRRMLLDFHLTLVSAICLAIVFAMDTVSITI
jgi:hypothetical protein